MHTGFITRIQNKSIVLRIAAAALFALSVALPQALRPHA